MVCIVLISRIRSLTVRALSYTSQEMTEMQISLFETRAGALTLAQNGFHAKHTLYLPEGQLLTPSDPLGINAWGSC